MSLLDLAVAIILLAAATLVTRSGILCIGETLTLSPRLESALRFAPACALTALIAPEILSPSGPLDLTLGNPRWLSAIAAGLFLAWRPSMAGGIAVGMGVYTALRLFAAA
jgi:branched-subunit amino acid transport protein